MIVYALLRQTRVHFLGDAALLLTGRMFDRAFRKAPSISNWIGAWHFSLEAAFPPSAHARAALVAVGDGFGV